MNRLIGQLKRAVKLLPTALLLSLSLLVLAYVGFGESHRTYSDFVLEKLVAQGQTIKTTIDTYLKAGLPLNQFPGFQPLTNPMLESDQSITEIFVIDTQGSVIFYNRMDKISDPNDGPDQAALIKESEVGFKPFGLSKDKIPITESGTDYRVALPLESKFEVEVVGRLKLTMPKSIIDKYINTEFLFVLYVLIGLTALFFVFLLVTEHRWGTHEKKWLQLSYGMIFFIMAAFLVFTLITIYFSGIQEKTKALADSLAQRMVTVLELGIDFHDIDGLEKAFADYKRLNADISYIALTQGDQIVIHTTPGLVGQVWTPREDHFEFTLPLTAGSEINGEGALARINVGIPKDIVQSKVWRNIKNFSVLFIASAFISYFLLDVFLFFRRSRDTMALSDEAQQDFKVDLVRPVFFLGVFIEGLHVSFLPQYFEKLATASDVAPSWTSTLFTLFFAAFALTLIPAGRYAETGGVKKLLLAGVLLSSTGLMAMALVSDFYLMGLVRIVAGMGQGMLFIGCQSYILMMASEAKKTQGAAIIVFGYNGGFVSGAAIGALLVNYMEPRGVFSLGGVLGLMILIYVLFMITEKPRAADRRLIEKGETIPGGRLFGSIGKVLLDFQFVKTMLLIGITTKAVLTGVAIFALPILMFQLDYAQEDIGQILMFYSGGVLLSSQVVARIVDRTGKTTGILFSGALGSGLGLILIGMMGRETVLANNIPFSATIILISGMLILGLAHGFINAPIITHIARTPVAGKLGSATTVSVYRFLERIGHVLGPIIVWQLIIIWEQDPIVLSWVGGILLLLGLVFILTPGTVRTTAQSS